MKKGVTKLIVLLIFLTILCPMLNFRLISVSYAYEDMQSLTKYLNDFISALYENKDIGMTHDLSQYIEGDTLKAYLSEKIAIHQLVTERAFLEKRDFQTDIKLLAMEMLDEVTYLVALSVKISFNYLDVDIDSGYGEVLNIIISDKHGDFTVLDIYAHGNYYDIEVRGDQVVLKDEYLGNQCLSFHGMSEITSKTNELANRMKSYYDELDAKTIGSQPKISVMTTTLNKANIAEYARNYCSANPPPSGGADVTYYDFSKIPGNYDCTNFVSHCLLSGGAEPYVDQPTTGWYYVDLNNRSHSWSGVSSFFNYLTRSTSIPGPYGDSIAYYVYDERQGYPYSNGDVLQHRNGTTWIHSTIITGVYLYYPSNPYYLAALVCGRTGVDWYNYNQKAEEIYPGNPKRVIRLAGNRL